MLEENSPIVTHLVKEGDLIIFPGWMDHGVKQSTSDEDRIVISGHIPAGSPMVNPTGKFLLFVFIFNI